jgi:hypothetical protein
MVFSIDTGPAVSENLAYLKNVSFLTGPSFVILPLLLKELDHSGIAVDFILIDGDHSAEGTKRDIGCLLPYIPPKPLLVVIHDSFNPGCRRGILEGGWEKSPYVSWVDIDFVPGRITEDKGPFEGQLWGGFALAYLLPFPRKDPLEIHCSTEKMFRTVYSSR